MFLDLQQRRSGLTFGIWQVTAKCRRLPGLACRSMAVLCTGPARHTMAKVYEAGGFVPHMQAVLKCVLRQPFGPDPFLPAAAGRGCVGPWRKPCMSAAVSFC